jgi:hypothetical protein
VGVISYSFVVPVSVVAWSGLFYTLIRLLAFYKLLIVEAGEDLSLKALLVPIRGEFVNLLKPFEFGVPLEFLVTDWTGITPTVEGVDSSLFGYLLPFVVVSSY